MTGGEDATVTFFDLETLTATKSLWVLDSTVKAVRFSFDGQHLAYCCQDERAIHIENCLKGKPIVPYSSKTQITSLQSGIGNCVHATVMIPTNFRVRTKSKAMRQ